MTQQVGTTIIVTQQLTCVALQHSTKAVISLGCDYSQQITDISIYRRTVGNLFFQTVSFVVSFVKSDFFHLPTTNTPMHR